VDLTADFRDIPIVYGLLDLDNEVNYIRIQKAFLPKDGESALDVALNPDSLYYNNIDVRLERVDNGESYPLERVDGEDEGLEKGEGVFANQPNYVYKLDLTGDEELIADREYRLIINRGDNLPEVTANAKVVGEAMFTSPFEVGQINIRYRDFDVTWRKAPAAAFYDLKMEIFFLEEDPASPGSFNEKSVIWNIENNIVPGSASQAVNYEFEGESFYQFIGGRLDDNQGFERIFQSLDFILDCGGNEIFEYINIGQANTGITSSQIIPTYTNLSEGFGVFSSRSRLRYENFTLKAESRDSLANGIYTQDLGFEF
jgi:hypothetical protein